MLCHLGICASFGFRLVCWLFLFTALILAIAQAEISEKAHVERYAIGVGVQLGL